MITDETRLQEMLDNSTTEYWFSRQNQNKLAYEHSAKLLIADSSLTPEDAIREATAFVNAFYNIVLKQTTKNYRG